MELLSQAGRVVPPSTWGAQPAVVTHDFKSEAGDAAGKSGEYEAIPLSYKIKPANKQQKHRSAAITSLRRS